MGQACQLLCREGRWSCEGFHPAGPRAAGLLSFHAAAPTAVQALFGGREENLSPSLLVFRETCHVLSRPQGWASTSLPGLDLGQTTGTSLTMAARESCATFSPSPRSHLRQHLSLLKCLYCRVDSVETCILLIFFFLRPLLSKKDSALFLGVPQPREANSHLHCAFRTGLPVSPPDVGLFINCVAPTTQLTAGWDAGLPDLANKMTRHRVKFEFQVNNEIYFISFFFCREFL